MRVISPGVKRSSSIWPTGVTSAAVPVRKISRACASSSGMMARSITSMPRAGEPDHRTPGNPVEEAVGRRRVQATVDDEKDIGARRLRH